MNASYTNLIYVLRAFCFLMLVCPWPSIAAIITFTDEATFLAAIGGSSDVSEDFNQYATDQSFANGSIDVGAFVLSAQGAWHNSQNIIDTSPFTFSGISAIDGTPYADFFVKEDSYGITSAKIEFHSPVFAFGATFKELSNGTVLEFLTSSGQEQLQTNTSGSLQFLGFVASNGEAFSEIAFLPNGARDGFGLDNVHIGNSLSAVPIPAAVWLFGSGLIGLIGLARRKANA